MERLGTAIWSSLRASTGTSQAQLGMRDPFPRYAQQMIFIIIIRDQFRANTATPSAQSDGASPRFVHSLNPAFAASPWNMRTVSRENSARLLPRSVWTLEMRSSVAVMM